VPSEPAEDERYVSGKRLSATAQAGSAAAAVWVKQQQGRENKGDVKLVDVCEAGNPRLQHAVNHVLPCRLLD